MNLAEVKLLQVEKGLPFKITKRRMTRGYLVINDLVPIPIECVNNSYDRRNDANIIDATGALIGTLCFTKGFYVNGIGLLTEDRFVCMIKEIGDHLQLGTALDLLSTSPYCFQNDYLIINHQNLDSYLDNYYNSAPLWGGFCHQYTGITITGQKKVVATLTPSICANFSKPYLYESAIRAIYQPLAFERFLKYYHLLELNFDFDLIQRIKTVDVDNDSKQIALLLNDYKKQDIERLIYLFTTYCSDITAIELELNKVASHVAIAKEIFYDFGKDSNPLTEDKFDAIIASPNKFTQINCQHFNVSNCNNNSNYSKFIAKFAMYMIYRIRNSIAHSKIGEYVMTMKDEEFIIEFGEPLLLAVIRQVFK